VLLDTSVLIDCQRSHPPALAWLKKNERQAFSISSITVLELMVGAETPQDRAALQAMFQAVSVIAIDEPIAWRAGELFRRFNKSHGTGRIDALIAATAQIARLPLATHNLKHFPMLENLRRPY
jgi:hypothetical protein